MIQSLNFATQFNGRFIFNKFPEIEYATQKNPIPDIRTVVPKIQGPRNPTPMQPSAIEYGDLYLDFMVTEGFTNYINMFTWIQQSISAANNAAVYSDARLMILDNQEQYTGTSVVFSNMFPSSLSGVELESTGNNSSFLVARVKLEYVYFTFETS